MIRFEIRAAGPQDEQQILALARYLNTVNLPHDHPHVARLLEDSERSFSGAIKSPPHRKYVFVLWDSKTERAVGTSMIVGQLGRRDAPYIYLDVSSEEKYSKLVDRHFHHTVLRVGYSYKGPTEIGGLVVHPEYRASAERLGLQISYVRFLYIAAHRELFQDEILAELMPPLEPDGTSLLWEALGRHFTEMSYAEADRLSSENKEFVRDLFPRGEIYASLLCPEAQAVIGKVGARTKGVEKMLRRIGFRYAERVDPFDGGPHFVAQADEITLVRDTTKTRLAGPLVDDAHAPNALVARECSAPPWFRALDVACEIDPKGAVRIPAEAIAVLGLREGDELTCLPIR